MQARMQGRAQGEQRTGVDEGGDGQQGDDGHQAGQAEPQRAGDAGQAPHVAHQPEGRSADDSSDSAMQPYHRTINQEVLGATATGCHITWSQKPDVLA